MVLVSRVVAVIVPGVGICRQARRTGLCRELQARKSIVVRAALYLQRTAFRFANRRYGDDTGQRIAAVQRRQGAAYDFDA